ncbi:hypothetical protein [Corallococcus sp. CA047B]|uniref:hypothetical protein n=1 Tax=Corallococcus sp. CA047B TaxID=2316729 RepID=UPI0011C42BAD|nr:hypothetical protein [Corallococcus sp. CA047B]
MRVGRGVLLMALVLGACSRPGANTEATDAGVIGLPGRPSPLAIPSCEVLLPEDLRDLTLNGFAMKEERACPTCGPLCTLSSAALPDVALSVAYDCQPGYASADVRALLAPTLNAGGEEVSALGRAAARRSPVQGMTQVVAWDDDTPCVVVVTLLGDEPDRAMDVARLAVTSHKGMEDAKEDAGTEAPRVEGDNPFGDAPLEPLDTLTAPRAGTTDVLSAPPGTRAPPPVVPAPAPRPPQPSATAPTGGGATPVRPAAVPPINVPAVVTPRPATMPVAPTVTSSAATPAPSAPNTATPAPSAPTAPTSVTPAPSTPTAPAGTPSPTPAQSSGTAAPDAPPNAE